MEQSHFELLQSQYHDYFMVEHQTHVNIRPLEGPIPNETEFELRIPAPFLMASEMTELDRSMLKPLARLGDIADDLALYLKAQARKIDTLMRYILLQQDDPSERYMTYSYGGSALNFISSTPLEPGQLLEIKLFLDQSEGAVFAYAVVLSVETLDQHFLVRTTYSNVREQDREIIVRASLHQQSRQLKRKAEQRQLAAQSPS